MITKITMDKVKSYKCPSFLKTDKKVNLIYGLNGTGKSTFSDYLYNMEDSCFANCSIEGLTDEEILVYNHSFINDYFYQPDNLKGIFTLSKENKVAGEKVKNAKEELTGFDIEKKAIRTKEDNYNTNLAIKTQNAIDKCWEIKTKFTNDNHILDYCLAKLTGKKEALFNYLLSIAKPDLKPSKTIEQLKKEVVAINGSMVKKYDMLPLFNFTGKKVESNQLFKKSVIGNENSTVASLIKKLDNSDWVKKGLVYIPTEISDEGEPCPFCQEKTITSKLIEKIKDYFDETYEKDISELDNLLLEYLSSIKLLPNKEIYEQNPFISEKKADFTNLYNAVEQCLINNKNQIAEKLKAPSQEVNLINSESNINDFNQFIETVNGEINEQNIKIDNKETSLEDIKTQFWFNMRWDYDQTLSIYLKEKTDIEKKLKELRDEKLVIDGRILVQKQIIDEQLERTVNIEQAITDINNDLIEFGIDDFRIEKYSDDLYKISRMEKCDNAFLTLSEGEKMIISFLYFCELCKGSATSSSATKKKIVVIDDPISSLSHIYIFNIGQLIKNDFLKSESYEQVFLLTHSLYFFYEMTEFDHDTRKKTQNLFRMIKNSSGSQISEMKYAEIQNDYHSFWSIVKDDKQPPALIANCMRNIIEYFFGFVEKKDLNNVFQKPCLKSKKYEAFNRYMNRESHSSGQNILDLKEFDYNCFKEALALVFTESGYPQHYEAMMK